MHIKKAWADREQKAQHLQHIDGNGETSKREFEDSIPSSKAKAQGRRHLSISPSARQATSQKLQRKQN